LENETAEERTGAVLILSDDEQETLAATVRRRGSLAAVASTRASEGGDGLREALADVVEAGVRRILIISTSGATGSDPLKTIVEREIARQRVYHPEVKIIYVTPKVDVEHQADLLVEHLRSVIETADEPEGVPLSVLPPHRAGTVQRLRGGREFVSRLAALGFIPGCPIEVIQNFGVGPLIVAIRDTRIALGRQEAEKVEVRPSNGGGSSPHRWRRRHHG
jgi:ferrous iron transport protein A